MNKSSEELRKEAKELGHKNKEVERVDPYSGETFSSSYLGSHAKLKSFDKLSKKEKKKEKEVSDTGAHPGNEDRRTARKEYFHLEESEFSDDLKNIYGIGKSDDVLRQEQEDKLRDLLDEIKDIRYGFKDKVTGEVYDNREWIHNCKDLSRYYEVQKDPRITLKDKLGICTDQCLAIEYLIKQKYQDIKPCLYALMKGRFGHCTLGFNDGDKYYYLENAWDKMKKDDKPTLYGPFESEDKLKDFFKDIYFKAHEKDNDDPVEVMRYNEYLQEYGLNESVDIRKFK